VYDERVPSIFAWRGFYRIGEKNNVKENAAFAEPLE
jgi:hypothetical protein